MRTIALIALALLISVVAFSGYVDYVNPFIGTGGHGHTFPGVVVPFGMIQPGPDTGLRGWDWCSGYHYSDDSIAGFSQTHLSGTGAADYGEVRIMPITGEVKIVPGPKENPDRGYRSRFSHSGEVSEPGYYSVFLEDYGINVEITASTRVALYRFTFPKSESSKILVDVFHRIGNDSEKAYVEIKGNNMIVGWEEGGHFCGAKYPHKIYFAIEFSKPFEEFGTWRVFRIDPGNRKERMPVRSDPFIGAYVGYRTEENEKILMKVAISYTGIDGALKNLGEIEGWDFEKVRRSAREMWERELSKIEVEADEKTMTKFYTALYHAFIHPSVFSDVDGRYIGPDDVIYKSDFPHYTVFSLWDTFRALHPLFNIVQSKRNAEMIRSLLDVYEEGGWLPKWYKANRYTNCMIGTHADSVIAEAFVKGVRDFDVEKAYEALMKDATKPADTWYEARGGISYYLKLGYIPADKVGEATSRTLEFAYDDYCIAQMAKLLGKTKDYETLMKRSRNYVNLFDKGTGFMRGKLSLGIWADPLFFNPSKSYPYYTEGTAWQWTFFVPHDVQGLIELFGGKENFSRKLDELFSTKASIEGPPDITGLIGQYAHGNEPSHHIPYLYVFADQPWKTQKLVRYIMDEMYGTKPDGLIGNEDCGQMSAWYILSALGFYPVNPCSGEYVIGSPVVKKAVIHLENGRTFEITVLNQSERNIYVKSVKLNDKELKDLRFKHSSILNGGKLIFEMNSVPLKGK